ncbi:hypothetical protein FH972_022791 [Carpinus fangiana]|uniref:L-ornithine N(5)-monooxygenase [NAD(P)H] n=1 Tax=Carpinus fangiana TaxID=176857 RepID=A0A5N6KTT7_9ROSI|nr:hypothetical protein FH972_022791 [Carpinus fangiana]
MSTTGIISVNGHRILPNTLSGSLDRKASASVAASLQSLHKSLSNGSKIDYSKSSDDVSVPKLDALVVGASWAGIWTLHLLKSQGFNVRLVDMYADLGGSWFNNRYPGCRVDTEIPLYEYSLPELWKEWNWTERFPSRVEIHNYLMWVTERLDLRKIMTFDTRISGAKWNENTHSWTVSSKDGVYCTTRYLLPCTGYSTVRLFPDIKGISSFPNSFHSSDWPEGSKGAFANKRVGIVGNAASGVQIIEAIAPHVAHLTVFQRTPNLSTPRRNVQHNSTSMKELKKSFPHKLATRTAHTGFSTKSGIKTFDHTPEQRQDFFERLWNAGGLAFWLENYDDLITSRVANAEAYAFWRAKVLARVADPAVAAKLAPEKAPHAFGTKRPALEDTYFDLFNQPNVTLVHLPDDPMMEVTPAGVRCAASGLHALDTLVFATGSDFLVGSMLDMDIRGVAGVPLAHKWDVRAAGAGVWTQLGLMTAGFPNMLFTMGPQAPSALGFTPHMAEIQGAWVRDCLVHLREAGMTRIEARVGEERRWKRVIDEVAARSLLSETDSWYMGVNIAGRKKQALNYFGGVDKYEEVIGAEAAGGYKGFNIE